MELRARFLRPMKLWFRLVLIILLVTSLALQIGTYYHYYHSYYPRFFHIIMIVGVIFLLLNPKGIRLLFFVFFSYLLIDIFTLGSYPAADMHCAIPSCILSLPLHWIGVSVNTIVYIHMVLYALLAYFSFNHSFLGKYTLESESEILDDLE